MLARVFLGSKDDECLLARQRIIEFWRRDADVVSAEQIKVAALDLFSAAIHAVSLN